MMCPVPRQHLINKNPVHVHKQDPVQMADAAARELADQGIPAARCWWVTGTHDSVHCT